MPTCHLICCGQPLPANTRVIRVMPNTPATVLCGASAFARGSTTRSEDGVTVSRLFSSIGFCIEVSEAELDAVTGVSGSGPAYVSTCSAVYLFIKSLFIEKMQFQI